MDDSTQHEFDEKDVCRQCACSKGFALKNNIVCKPLPKDKRYYCLQYWSIYEMFDRLREPFARVFGKCQRYIQKIHFMGDIPIDRLEWWVEQWGKYRKEIFKIHINAIKSQLMDPDGFTNSTFMDKYWKDPQWP